MSNPIIEVQKFGQSIWYDNIRRGLITSGELATMVQQDGLLGVASNPAIIEKAPTGSTDDDQATKAMVAQKAALTAAPQCNGRGGSSLEATPRSSLHRHQVS